MDWQSIVASGIVLIAAAWLVRRVVRIVRGATRGGKGEIGGCGNCSNNPNNAPREKVVSLGSIGPVKRDDPARG